MVPVRTIFEIELTLVQGLYSLEIKWWTTELT